MEIWRDPVSTSIVIHVENFCRISNEILEKFQT